MEALSQYPDHEEEEEEATAPEAAVKKDDERILRSSSADTSDDTKSATVPFIRRKRKSTTEGEPCVLRLCTAREQKVNMHKACSVPLISLPQGRCATVALFTLQLSPDCV